MKVGGGGRERWMVILPVAALTVVVTVWLGGPADAISAFEHLMYDIWGEISLALRR